MKQEALNSAQIEAKAANYAAAVAILEEALKQSPGDIDISSKKAEYENSLKVEDRNSYLAKAEESATGGRVEEAFKTLDEAIKKYPGDPDIIARTSYYQDLYTEKANILNKGTSEGVEIYKNEWNSVTPFRINKTVYNQDDIIGLRFLKGGWRGSETVANLSMGFYGFAMKIDNSNLEYSRITYKTAFDDLHKDQSPKNSICTTMVYAYSKALGSKPLYSFDMKTDSKIYEHTVDILGYEEIYIFYRSFDTQDWIYYGRLQKSDWRHNAMQDYVLIFEPVMLKY
jgi:tetratricopeptide (TPR) repeat protein